MSTVFIKYMLKTKNYSLKFRLLIKTKSRLDA